MSKPKQLSIREVFDRAFASKDKYFGEWYVHADDSLSRCLEEYQKNSITNLSRQLSYLYLYFESLELLKEQAKSKEWAISSAMSKELWYCNMLLLLIGLIDQHTKNELKIDGKTKSQGERFALVMESLKKDEQRHLLQHFGGHSKHKTFKQLVMHIYSTRTFFAHEIMQPKNSIPQDGFLATGSEVQGKEYTFYINLPHGRLFLYVVIAFLRYIGYGGELEIKSDQKFDSFADLLRQT